MLDSFVMSIGFDRGRREGSGAISWEDIDGVFMVSRKHFFPPFSETVIACEVKK